VKSHKACTAYHRQESLPRNSSRKDWQNMDTTKAKIINGFWKHKTRPICFALVVDDFAVKYVNEEDAEHLINAIKKYYPMTVDKEATKYIRLTIEWDYTNRKAHIHMPGYLQKALTRFKHETPDKIQNSPHPHVIPQYRAKTQHTNDKDISP
jgi:hypothetical protein